MKPLPHQHEAITKLKTSPFLILAYEAGLGKTFIALQAAKELGLSFAIFAPKSTLKQWEATAKKVGVNPLFIFTNSAKSVEKAHTSFNHESTPQILILDEAHQGAGDTKFTRLLLGYAKLGAGNAHIWALTASPIRDGKILNAWLLYALVKLKTTSFIPNYWKFRQQYAVFNETNYFVGNRNDELFARGMKPYILRATYEDVGKEQTITPEQLRHSPPRNFIEDLVQAYMETKEESEETFNFVSLLLHLRQSLALEATHRTLEVIATNREKCLVFSNFVAPLYEIQQQLTKPSIIVTGGTSNRDEAFTKLKTGEVEVLLTTFATTSTGVDFPEVNHTIFNDLPLESTQLHQAIMRTVRINSSLSASSKLFQFVNCATIVDEWVLAILAEKITTLRQFITVPTLKNIPDSKLKRKQALMLLQEIILYDYESDEEDYY